MSWDKEDYQALHVPVKLTDDVHFFLLCPHLIAKLRALLHVISDQLAYHSW